VLHFVEQRRHALDLVDDDPGAIGQGEALLAEQRRVARQPQALAGEQQVVLGSRREVLLDPGRLAGATGA
jgi:hypothetical protein